MALTALPISTISYNSKDFLLTKLDELFNAGKLDDYRTINHKGEGGDKDHWHVFMIPTRRIDTAQLRMEFQEIDINNPEKPLGVMPMRKSSSDDWLMYSLHDEAYLKTHSKNDEANHKIRYQLEDVITPFIEQLQRDYKRAISLRRTEAQIVIDELDSGTNLRDIMYMYDISPIKIQAIYNAWSNVKYKLEQEQYKEANKDRNNPFIPELSKSEKNPFED